MTYIPLARKYRPSQFTDLIGQEAVVKALSNAIELKREPHAVVFTGTRGVGKTTTARLYAKALNCDNGPSANPCDSCTSCMSIAECRHEDVLEIDGASHNGVDEVRELQESLAYVPQRSPFRIFIIDEVHMLSSSAFNALLKTLEEPPEHVVFVFATTELNKVPPTILSRCQVFHLPCLSIDLIEQRLGRVLDAEGISYEPTALSLIAEHGRGSMRDALTFLDQVIALGGGSVTEIGLKSLISRVDGAELVGFLTAMLMRDAQVLVAATARWEQSGLSMIQIIETLSRYCRHAMIVKDIGRTGLGTTLFGDDLALVERLALQARDSSPLDLNRIFRLLVRCREELSGSTLDRFIIENNLLEWCFDPGLPTVDEIMQALKSGGGNPTARPGAPTPIGSPSPAPNRNLRAGFESLKNAKTTPLSQEPVKIENKAEAVEQHEPKPVWPSDWRNMVEQWKKRKPLEARMLEECNLVKYNTQEIVLSVSSGTMVGNRLSQADVQNILKRQMDEMFGFKGRLSILAREESLPNSNETLLEERLREKKIRDARIIEDSKSDRLTLDAIQLFGARVEHVELRS